MTLPNRVPEEGRSLIKGIRGIHLARIPIVSEGLYTLGVTDKSFADTDGIDDGIIATPFYPDQDLRVTAITIKQLAAENGDCRIGIYSSDPINGLPYELLAGSDVIELDGADTVGKWEVDFYFQRGVGYWIAIQISGGDLSLEALDEGGAYPLFLAEEGDDQSCKTLIADADFIDGLPIIFPDYDLDNTVRVPAFNLVAL